MRCVFLHLALICDWTESENVNFIKISDEKCLFFILTIKLNSWSTDPFCHQSSQTTQLYITKVFYKQFSCHDYIKNLFSWEILIKLTLSDSEWHVILLLKQKM
jgi:hypothetical protein